MDRPIRKRSGFTLVEMLVVTAIMSVILSLLLPSLNQARQEAVKVVCQSNLRQLGVAGEMHLQDHDNRYWRYFTDEAGGRRWWFGFEEGGPGAGMHRPLDQTGGVLYPYLGTTDDLLECPAFDYGDRRYFPKFAEPSASYGYNLRLGSSGGRRQSEFRHPAEVIVFADGIHFDFNPGYNEGHYLSYTPVVAFPSGYAHFRHNERAQYVHLDGHVGQQELAGDMHADIGGPAGNLASSDGSNRIYGYD